MGLERVVATPASGIVDPRSGRAAGAEDAFFAGLNGELADKSAGVYELSAGDAVLWRFAAPR